MKAPTVTKTDFSLPGQTAVYHGKVRDVYTINNNVLVSVASDRISAFDVILPRPIPYKGQILNQTAAYFLEATKDVAPNWLLSVPDPNVSIGKKLEPFRIELIVRGGLVGSAWREYKSGTRELCGIALPDGMQEYDLFPEPIITPTTKAEAGHDENISAADIVAQGLATKAEFDRLSGYARALFKKGQTMAASRGLILVDTKYEFGKEDSDIYLIDEIHTPDSSRYFYKESYEAFLADRQGEAPKHLSKEFVREWLMENGFSGQTGEQVPEMTDEVVASISERYIELFEHLTGQTFEQPADDIDLVARIEANVRKALETG